MKDEECAPDPYAHSPPSSSFILHPSSFRPHSSASQPTIGADDVRIARRLSDDKLTARGGGDSHRPCLGSKRWPVVDAVAVLVLPLMHHLVQ
jgi:hypothetical protein